MAVINVFEAGAQLGSPASRASDVRPDMSGAAAVARADAQLVNTAVQGGFALYDQIAAADVMAANNTYNEKMAKLQTELMQNKEEHARDNLAKYEEGRQKIVGEILKNGPSTLRYGRNAAAFQNTIDRDWIGQRTQMERYQIGEMERYQDTQLNNQFASTLKDVVANYNDEEALQGYMNRGAFMAEMRYQNYGAERTKAEQDKWNAAVVGTAVTAAVNADDYDRAGALLQGYGGLLTSEQRMSFDKVINARRKDEQELAEFEALYAKYNNDIDGALREMDANYGTADIAKGMSYVKGEIGKHWGSNQCSNFTGSYIREAGGDVGIISSLADGTYRNAEEKGLTFTDRAQLRDGDLVFWSVDGSKYTASNNPNDVHSDSKAYKGITHVGVYDAKTGKVIQSGEHGVSAMDLDAAGYHVVGFSHIGGRGMSNVEREKQRKGYISFAASREGQKRAASDAMYNQFLGDVMVWKQNGMSYNDALLKAGNLFGDNAARYGSAMRAVKSAYYDYFGDGKSGGAGVSKNTIYSIKEALGHGVFSNKEEFEEYIQSVGVSPVQYGELGKEYDNYINRKGSYAIDWTGIKESVVGDLKGPEKEQAWIACKESAVEWINAFEHKNGYMPGTAEIKEACRDGLIRQYYGQDSYTGEKLEFYPGTLKHAGIKDIRSVGGGIFAVDFIDPKRPTEAMSGDRIKELLGR